MYSIYKKFILLCGLIGCFLAPQVNASFEDVDTTHPYFHAIEELFVNQIVQGYKTDEGVFFRPFQKISRAEALKILVLSRDIQINANARNDFPDIKRTDWFYPYIITAAEAQIVKGFADGKFYPGANVTRAEFAKMVIESFHLEIDTTNANPWYTPYMDWVNDYKIIPGGPSAPDGILTRGEVAEILYRMNLVARSDFAKKYIYKGTGQASYYNKGFAGRPTATGEIYDPMDMTAAHRTLPFGTKLLVHHNGKSVVVRINDRGPYHEKRILDLSEKAFSKLAPVSRGVIDIEFEIFQHKDDTPPSIPAVIKDSLSEETKNEVPDIIAQNLNISTDEPDYPHETESSQNPRYTKPVIAEKISSVSTKAWNESGVTLRRSMPTTIMAGTIKNISGTTLNAGHQEISVFLKKLGKTPVPDEIFSAEISGKNFSVPVAFLSPGKYHMGIVLDGAKNSIVHEIDVKEFDRFPARPVAEIVMDLKFDVYTDAFEKSLFIDLFRQNKTLVKIELFGNKKMVPIFVEPGVDQVKIPFSFLQNNPDFAVNEQLALDFFVAETNNGTLDGITDKWTKKGFANYTLRKSFNDIWQKDVIDVRSFSRFATYKKGQTIKIRKKLNTTKLREEAFVIQPDGSVKPIRWVFNGNEASIFFRPDQVGIYVLQIVGESGETFFKRAIYTEQEKTKALPVMEWTGLSLGNLSGKVGTLSWVNRFRAQYNLSRLSVSTELDEIAQDYAQRMVDENFIGHVSPDGGTFDERISRLKPVGTQFAENLALADTQENALQGLEFSPSHRRALMGDFDRIGIGMAKKPSGEIVIVQIFAK